MLAALTSNQYEILQVTREKFEALDKAISSYYEKTMNNIELQDKENDKRFNEQTQLIASLNYLVRDSSKEILKAISVLKEDIFQRCTDLNATINKESQLIKKDIAETASSTNSLFRSHIDSLIETSKTNIDTFMQTNKVQSEKLIQLIDYVSQQASTLQASTISISDNLIAKSDTINQTIIKMNEGLRELLTLNESKTIESINTNISRAITLFESNINTSKEVLAESINTFMQTNNEHSEGIKGMVKNVSQQTAILQTFATSISDNFDLRSNNIDNAISHTNEVIKEQFRQNESRTKEIFESSISDMQTFFISNMKASKESVNDMINLLIQTNNKQHSTLQQELESANQRSTDISSLISENIKESDKATEEFLQSIKTEYNALHKNIIEIQSKAENIEKVIYTLSDNSSEKIISSIKSIITEFKKELENSASGISSQIFDTQISQEAISNELSKLHIVLRSILKSFEKNNSSIVGQISKAEDVEASSDTMPFLPESKSNPNRTETIVDEETQNVVFNQYQNDSVIKSTMKNAKGQIIYELDYINEKIVHSRNYDQKGNLTIEQTFYDNGQIHYRNEYTKDGKKTTEFDINGKKK